MYKPIVFAEPKSVTVSKAGVVKINPPYKLDILVNSHSMLEMLEKAMDKTEIMPEMDSSQKFAGKVTITVEFLGDMKENMALSYEERLALKLEENENEENSHPV